MRCPHCAERLAKDIDGGRRLVKARYLIVDDEGRMQVACPACKALLPAPGPRQRLGLQDH